MMSVGILAIHQAGNSTCERDLLTPDSRLRLCAHLLALAGHPIGLVPYPGTHFPINKEELALTANMPRQRVHEILIELVKNGFCEVVYGLIVLRDPKALAALFL